MKGFSVCDFWWTGRRSLPNITVFAEAHHLTKAPLFITAFEIEMNLDGTLFFHRQAAPLVWPMHGGNAEILSSPLSGRLFIGVEHNIGSYTSRELIKEVYVIGVDENGEMFCRFPPDLFDPEVPRQRHIDHATVSPTGELLRVAEPWRLT